MKPDVRAKRDLTTRNGDYRELEPYVQLRTIGRRLWEAAVLVVVVAFCTAGLIALFVLLE